MGPISYPQLDLKLIGLNIEIFQVHGQQSLKAISFESKAFMERMQVLNM